MKNKYRAVFYIVIFMLILCRQVVINNVVSYAAAQNDESDSGVLYDEDSYSKEYKDIDKAIKSQTGLNISFKDIVANVNTKQSLSYNVKTILNYISQVFLQNRKMLIQIIILCVLSAFINIFSPFFNQKQLKDTAVAVIALTLTASLLVVYMGVYATAKEAMDNLVNIYKVICMVFIPAVYAAGAGISAAGYYQIIIWMIAAADVFIKSVLFGLDKIYIVMSMCDSIEEEEHFKKAKEMIKKSIKWCGGSVLTVFMGLGGIKSIINPVKDSLNTAYIYKAAGMIPGIGSSAELLSQTVVASSCIIKNSIGVAGIIVIIICMAAPVIKLVLIFTIYQGVAAIIEPVSDKRIIRIVTALGDAAGMLIYLLVIAFALFVLTIALICVSTN